MFVCVCVWREREREGERDGERGRACVVIMAMHIFYFQCSVPRSPVPILEQPGDSEWEY